MTDTYDDFSQQDQDYAAHDDLTTVQPTQDSRPSPTDGASGWQGSGSTEDDSWQQNSWGSQGADEPPSPTEGQVSA
jgi:hypothetical protein